MASADSVPTGGRREFLTTRWSVVLQAAGQCPADSREALEQLCGSYWYPLYAYVRRRVRDVHEARDLTQAFFARLLERDTLALADRQRGRFRSFLLTALKNFVTNEWHKAQAQKRGGDLAVLSFDFDDGDSRYRLEPAHDVTPETLFERQWAVTLLDRVLARLQDEFAASGRAAQFQQLKQFLSGSGDEAHYAHAAEALNATEGAVRVAVHRMRRRYRQLLKDEIAQTVADPQDVDDEIRRLFDVLAG